LLQAVAIVLIVCSTIGWHSWWHCSFGGLTYRALRVGLCGRFIGHVGGIDYSVVVMHMVGSMATLFCSSAVPLDPVL